MQGKVGKREGSSRKVEGPIHVFEGKRKPGATGWPEGITWMVSETYRGSLEGVKWPSSLVGIVLLVSQSRSTPVMSAHVQQWDVFRRPDAS